MKGAKPPRKRGRRFGRYTVKMIRFTLAETTGPDPNGRNLLDNPGVAKPLCIDVHRRFETGQERVLVFCLDFRRRLIGWRELYRGTLTGAKVEPREFFKTALAMDAVSILVSHNHPSGHLYPCSQEDQSFTDNLVIAGEIMGIPVLDHIVVGDGTGKAFSFVEEGSLSLRRREQLVSRERLARAEKPSRGRRPSAARPAHVAAPAAAVPPVRRSQPQNLLSGPWENDDGSGKKS